jgi:hypothetical protein
METFGLTLLQDSMVVKRKSQDSGVLDAVFLWLAFSVNLQLLGSRVEY